MRDEIETYFRTFGPGTPGCAVSVRRGDEIVFRQCYGLADVGLRHPVDPGTVFALASASKQLTGALIAILARRGALSLDDPLRKHLPWASTAFDPVTLRHLLHHTSGLADPWLVTIAAGWRPGELLRMEDMRDFATHAHALEAPPGARFLYSNLGYVLLALAAQEAGRAAFRTLCEREVFAPLGMAHTFVREDHAEIVAGLAGGYGTGSDGRVVLKSPLWQVFGSTGVYGTAEDLERWAMALMEPGLLPNFDPAEAMAPGSLGDGTDVPYGFGVAVGAIAGRPAVWHGGFDSGFRAFSCVIPEERVSVVILSNLESYGAFSAGQQIARIALGEAASPASDAPTPTGEPLGLPFMDAARDDGGEFCGSYRSDELDVTYEVAFERGGLFIERRRWGRAPLRPVSADRFACVNDDSPEEHPVRFAVSFERDALGAVVGMRVAEWTRQPLDGGLSHRVGILFVRQIGGKR